MSMRAMRSVAAVCAAFTAFAAYAVRPVVTNDYNGVKVIVNYDKSRIAPYTLEEPLTFVDGRKVAAKAVKAAESEVSRR